LSEIPKKVKELIDDKNIAHLATLKNNGSPHVTPVWIDRVDNTILVNVSENRLKLKNMKNDKRIALSIVNHNDSYEWASIIGEVIDITNMNADVHLDKLSQKYLGLSQFPWKQKGEIRIIVKIAPKTVYYN
jgi:PPOX class probable F420-dependent enzyme|tara:strand:- start:2694 stop:3086 length:393 start_codon:yes stop_codon:yes gene_type:complete